MRRSWTHAEISGRALDGGVDRADQAACLLGYEERIALEQASDLGRFAALGSPDHRPGQRLMARVIK
jgi:hypothetical protein